jgi:hypothetical protein
LGELLLILSLKILQKLLTFSHLEGNCLCSRVQEMERDILCLRHVELCISTSTTENLLRILHKSKCINTKLEIKISLLKYKKSRKRYPNNPINTWVKISLLDWCINYSKNILKWKMLMIWIMKDLLKWSTIYSFPISTLIST